MLPNISPEIFRIIDSAQHPVLILAVSEGCEDTPTVIQTVVEDALQQHPDPVVFYTMCIPEHLMSFPRAATPALYYFVPKNQMPVFWRTQNPQATISDDLAIVKKMMGGMTYDQARFTPEELDTVLKVDYFLEQEKDTLSTFPSTFQMARNLATEMWKTGKRAARGLPVLVPAQVGFSRLSTCESCEHFEAASSRCKQCGCNMKTKSQLASASCPINKWPALTT